MLIPPRILLLFYSSVETQRRRLRRISDSLPKSPAMAESATEEPPSLAEQWSLQDIEKTDQTEASVKQTNGDENPADVSSEEVTAEKNGESFASDAVTEKSDQTLSAEEASAVEEMNGEAPEEQETEVPQVEEKPEIKIETAPADFRFPTTNQTRHCFTRYIEYHRCIAAKGEDASECNKFASTIARYAQGNG